MNVFLHIGWHKTGTTAIQKFLFRNRQTLRERLGMNYPAAGLHHVAHNLPAWALQVPLRARLLEDVGCRADAASIFRDMLDETARLGLGALLISSEEFSPIHRYSLERLAEFLAGHQVDIIAYVRRQDEHIESTYNQMVKFRRSRLVEDFATFVNRQLKGGRLDYYRYFRRWADVFGRERLRIRVYGRSRFREGDARRDFCDVIGLDDAGLAFEAIDSNESLDFDSVCFLSRFNAVPLTEKQHDAVLAALREFAQSNPLLHYGLLGLEERTRIVSHFAESNQKFAREFLGRPDAFEPVDPVDNRLRSNFDEKRFMEMLSYVVPRLLCADERAVPSGQGIDSRSVNA